ncbi:MAG: hypothetical protein HZB33_13115 [Nitrospirae bacterium]|nr:hypothetical protein [Nitrospirota bacterium]
MAQTKYLIQSQFIKLRWLSRADSQKILFYLLFSSISILVGYSFDKEVPSTGKIFFVLSLLPIVYLFNHSFVIAYSKFAKIFLPLFKTENRDGILGAHVIVSNLILVALLLNWLFSFSDIPLNSTFLSVMLVYSVFFSLHRILKNSELDQNTLPSYLKYKSSRHTHILAATAIGLPFLLGLSLTQYNFNLIETLRNTIVTYGLFTLAWAILYQAKFRPSEFLHFTSIRSLIPAACYPVFPIFFFIFYSDNLLVFILLFFLMICLYFLPMVDDNMPTHSIMNNLLDERLFLLFVLLILLIANWLTYGFNICPWAIKVSHSIDRSKFYGNYPNIFIAVVGLLPILVNIIKDPMKSYQYLYFFLPYAVINFSHVIMSLNRFIPVANQQSVNQLSFILLEVEQYFTWIFAFLVVTWFMKKDSIQFKSL